MVPGCASRDRDLPMWRRLRGSGIATDHRSPCRGYCRPGSRRGKPAVSAATCLASVFCGVNGTEGDTSGTHADKKRQKELRHQYTRSMSREIQLIPAASHFERPTALLMPSMPSSSRPVRALGSIGAVVALAPVLVGRRQRQKLRFWPREDLRSPHRGAVGLLSDPAARRRRHATTQSAWFVHGSRRSSPGEPSTGRESPSQAGALEREPWRWRRQS